MEAVIHFIVDAVAGLGYAGIFLLMFLESSFFPFPSEVVMVPAGYLASKGEMNLFIAILMGILGSLGGALFNYWLAVRFGRDILLKYGRYLMIDEAKMKKLECFFDNHGHISTFSGRLIPGIRQYISLPAGLARMNLKTFCLYTSLGAGIWVAILAGLGYFIGENEALIKTYLTQITIGVVAMLVVLGAGYYWFVGRSKRTC